MMDKNCEDIIQIKNLSHSYNAKVIYKNLNLNIKKGSKYAILGKNGVGKSTLINILMGYLKPTSGECLILGENSYNLSDKTKKDIALLHEGFISYDFMSIKEYETFFKAFYEKWDSHIFYELIDLMKLDYNQKLISLSFGQKSQVVLGGLFAQNAKLLILDDYSMGLDVGYRRLFIDYLKDYVKDKDKTLLITSHIMSDLVDFIDDIAIVQKGGLVHQNTIDNFMHTFKCYEYNNEKIDKSLIHRIEKYKQSQKLFTFESIEFLQELETNFEEKFLGFVGKY